MRLDLEPTSSPMLVAEPSTSPSGLNNNANAVSELLAEGVKAAQAGSRGKARAALLRAVEVDGRSESAWLWLASISEYPEELLVFLNHVLEINPENQRAIEWSNATKSLLSKTLVQRGVDAVEEKKRHYAIQCFDQALEYDQSNSIAWLWMASLADSSEGKIAYFERVLAIDESNETALDGFRAAKNDISQRQLAEARQAAVGGRIAEANEFLDAIIEENPDAEDAWVLRAHLAENFESKIAAYERVLLLNPANFAARSGIDSLRSIIETVVPRAPVAASINVESPRPAEPLSAPADLTADKNPTQDLELPIGFVPPVYGEGFADEGRDEFVAEESTASVATIDVDVEGTGDVPMNAAYVIEKTESPHTAHGFTVEHDNAASEETFIAEVTGAGNFSRTETREVDVASELEYQKAESRREYENSIHETQTGDSVSYTFAQDALRDVATSESVEPPAAYVDTYVPAMNSDERFDANALAPAMPFRSDAPLSGVSVVSVAGAGNTFAHVVFCPFCNGENDAQSVACQTCMAVLTLSDIEMLINNSGADKMIMRDAVERLERERLSREFSEAELTMLGIGHLNLRNLQYGFNYLQQAADLNPNNVVLGSQVNALHIRLEEVKRRDEVQQAMPKGKTILVVDDSPTVRKLITGKLEKSGHEVFCSNDGVDAIELLEKLIPDLVLLDITMPRIDGYRVCKSIRSNPTTKDIPVVMISGKDGFFDKVRGRMAGATGYITKPFGPETLMKAVETYLGEAESAEIIT